MTTLTTEEFEMLYDVARRFVLEKLRPLEEELDTNDGVPRDVWSQLTKTSIDLGLYNANVPAEFGGAGLTQVQLADLNGLIGLTSWPFIYLMARPSPLLFGASPEQQEEYLKPVMAAQRSQCFALTEPDAGSYTAGIKTRAEKVPGGWSITGSKHFISNGELADFVIVIAVTGQNERGRPETTAFFVDKEPNGFSVAGRQEGIGFRGVQQREIVFDHAFVPDNKILGEVGQGMDHGFRFIAERRLALAAWCVGVQQRAIDLSVAFLYNRMVDGGMAITKQGLRWKLAQMEADYFACNAVLRAAADKSELVLRSAPGELPVSVVREAMKEVSIAKWMTTTAANRAADTAVQLHGGLGWTKGYPTERMFRDVRATRIMDGTDEIHQEIIAREVISSRK